MQMFEKKWFRVLLYLGGLILSMIFAFSAVNGKAGETVTSGMGIGAFSALFVMAVYFLMFLSFDRVCDKGASSSKLRNILYVAETAFGYFWALMVAIMVVADHYDDTVVHFKLGIAYAAITTILLVPILYAWLKEKCDHSLYYFPLLPCVSFLVSYLVFGCLCLIDGFYNFKAFGFILMAVGIAGLVIVTKKIVKELPFSSYTGSASFYDFKPKKPAYTPAAKTTAYPPIAEIETVKGKTPDQNPSQSDLPPRADELEPIGPEGESTPEAEKIYSVAGAVLDGEFLVISEEQGKVWKLEHVCRVTFLTLFKKVEVRMQCSLGEAEPLNQSTMDKYSYTVRADARGTLEDLEKRLEHDFHAIVAPVVQNCLYDFCEANDMMETEWAPENWGIYWGNIFVEKQ